MEMKKRFEMIEERGMERQFSEWMEQGFGKMGITLSERQMEQFYRYYTMLIETNRVMNLTAITEMKDVVVKHFVDSAALVRAVENLNEREPKIIDVGTGAGFPGIPLKIAFPNLQVTLLDSLNKRVKFLQNVIDELELKEIQGIHGRAEDFGGNPSCREQYDFCVSRAVANLSTLSEYCLPFVKVGGCFVSYKSGTVEEELDAARSAVEKLGGTIERVIKFSLEEAEAERSFVVIRKKKESPKKYPRKAGLPSKEPLR